MTSLKMKLEDDNGNDRINYLQFKLIERETRNILVEREIK